MSVLLTFVPSHFSIFCGFYCYRLGRHMQGLYQDDEAWGEEREMGSLMEVTGFVTQDGVNEDNTIKSITGGGCHTLALSQTGYLYFFGTLQARDEEHKFAFSGSLTGFNPTPLHIPVGKKVVRIHSGGNFVVVGVESGQTTELLSFGTCLYSVVLNRRDLFSYFSCEISRIRR